MKPIFVPHADYQAFVLKQLHTHYGPGVGTFYDFFPCLWGTVDKHIKPKKQRRRKGKAKKGKK